MTAILETIFISARAAAPMVAVEEAQAVAFQGLVGDRYGAGTGYWSDTDPCQVTLIGAADLAAIAETTGVAVMAGQHRRNLVIGGMDMGQLTGKTFRIGAAAVFRFERPRPPCAYIAGLTEPGMTPALAGRGGICVGVLRGGTIRRGDIVEVLGDHEAVTIVRETAKNRRPPPF